MTPSCVYDQAVSLGTTCTRSNTRIFIARAKLKQSRLFERGGIYGIYALKCTALLGLKHYFVHSSCYQAQFVFASCNNACQKLLCCCCCISGARVSCQCLPQVSFHDILVTLLIHYHNLGMFVHTACMQLMLQDVLLELVATTEVTA